MRNLCEDICSTYYERIRERDLTDRHGSINIT